jgi:hypothetical protein
VSKAADKMTTLKGEGGERVRIVKVAKGRAVYGKKCTEE